MRVAIVGSGYVGLVTGVCLAEAGHDVTCVDLDPAKVAQLNAATPHFFEPGLPELLARHAGRNFRATGDLAAAVAQAELTLIAVGTPTRDDAIDLTQIRQAAEQIGRALAGGLAPHVVVVKSTVVPGTTDDVVRPLLEAASGRNAATGLSVCVNPEFLSEGTAVEDFRQPDRIVLGAADAQGLDALEQLYAHFTGVEVVRTTPKAAEAIKYASNALLATLISFSNEIGNLCAALGGVDVADVLRGVHLSQYLNPLAAERERVRAPITAFLAAGCGFGGSCLPKDVAALVRHGRDHGQSMPLLSAVLQVNRAQPAETLRLLEKHFPDLRGVRVSVLGLAFKPQTDDVRHSPALPILQELVARGAEVTAHDPCATAAAAAALAEPRIRFCTSLEDALTDAQALVLVTRWDEYRRLPELLAGRAAPPLLVDGRRLIERSSVPRYEGIGLSVAP